LRTDVSFDSGGLRVAGHLYTPDEDTKTPRPAIVVGHTGSGVKEQVAKLVDFYEINLVASAMDEVAA
jgi:hypothetical protein